MVEELDTESGNDRRIGSLVGARWKLERRLGSGGMATVYAATDEAGQRVAVKLLHEEMARKSDVRARFLQEAYIANRIGHPGAVKILDHGQGDDTYLVMELLEGVPLGTRLRQADSITVRELLGYADQILDVLASAHDAGIVHRDIKPDNVFLTHTGEIRILDFGIARVLDDVPSAFKTRTGMALGTVPYMAPEQALGKRAELDGRVDLFALGALLFRVLAGRRIHEANSEAELLVAMATAPAPKLLSVAPAVPLAVCAIVDTALAYNRDARYPNARAMQADVRAVLAGETPTHAAGALVIHDAPTRIEVAPASVAPVSHAPVSHALLVDGPMSMGPVSQGPLSHGPVSQSYAGAMSATLPAPVAVTPTPAPVARAARAGLGLLALLGGGALLLLAVAGIALFVFKPWESIEPLASPDPASAGAQPPAAGAPVPAASAASATDTDTTAPGGQPASAAGATKAGDPASPAPAASPTEKAARTGAPPAGAAPATGPAPASAPTSTAAGASTGGGAATPGTSTGTRPPATATAPAPAPTPTTTTPPPASTAPATGTGRGQGKSKGGGHGKSK